MPVDPGFARRLALAILAGRPRRNFDGSLFLFTLRTLPPDAQENFAAIIVSFFLTRAAESLLFGRLLRRLRLDGLDLKTQAEVVIKTVSCYG
jgi:hypothetical protein